MRLPPPPWLAVLALPLALWAQPQQPPATFQTGTRLVEVQVIVRDQPIRPPGARAWFAWVFDSGPPFGPPGIVHSGLTKDDFVLLDQGKPQQIAVFHSNGTASSSDDPPLPVPAGAVSNRGDTHGEPARGATAILIDFLNTDFGCLAYERIGMNRLVRSFAEGDDRVALYTLGENLHVLHDFTGDPQQLKDAAAQLEQPQGKLPPPYAEAVRDYGDLLDLGREQVHRQMTTKALRLIIQHLAGVPGRKSLVWLMHHTANVPPAAVAMAQQANIVLYPVLVRTVPGGGCEGEPIPNAEQLARVTGARAFFDSLDLVSAVHTTEEDSSESYVLGYYPAEQTLDGKYHTITVKLNGKQLQRQNLEIHYRPGYLATKLAVPPPPPSPQELFEGPVDFTGIGLTAQSTPDKQRPGSFDLKLAVNLHDIHLEPKDGHFTGTLDVSIPNPAQEHSVQTATITLYMNNQQLAAALEKGFPLSVAGARPISGEIRVVVRDRATGAAGSIRVPVTATP